MEASLPYPPISHESNREQSEGGWREGEEERVMVGGRGEAEGRGLEEFSREIREMPWAHFPQMWTRWCHYTGISQRERERGGGVTRNQETDRGSKERVREGKRQWGESERFGIYIVQRRERKREGEGRGKVRHGQSCSNFFLLSFLRGRSLKKEKPGGQKPHWI